MSGWPRRGGWREGPARSGSSRHGPRGRRRCSGPCCRVGEGGRPPTRPVALDREAAPGERAVEGGARRRRSWCGSSPRGCRSPRAWAKRTSSGLLRRADLWDPQCRRGSRRRPPSLDRPRRGMLPEQLISKGLCQPALELVGGPPPARRRARDTALHCCRSRRGPWPFAASCRGPAHPPAVDEPLHVAASVVEDPPMVLGDVLVEAGAFSEGTDHVRGSLRRRRFQRAARSSLRPDPAQRSPRP